MLKKKQKYVENAQKVSKWDAKIFRDKIQKNALRKFFVIFKSVAPFLEKFCSEILAPT